MSPTPLYVGAFICFLAPPPCASWRASTNWFISKGAAGAGAAAGVLACNIVSCKSSSSASLCALRFLRAIVVSNVLDNPTAATKCSKRAAHYYRALRQVNCNLD